MTEECCNPALAIEQAIRALREILGRAPGVRQFFDCEGFIANELQPALDAIRTPSLSANVKPQPEARSGERALTACLKAQEAAIEWGNMVLELQSALAMLVDACTEARWPLTAEQMAPMDMARKALKLSPPQSNEEQK